MLLFWFSVEKICRLWGTCCAYVCKALISDVSSLFLSWRLHGEFSQLERWLTQIEFGRGLGDDYGWSGSAIEKLGVWYTRNNTLSLSFVARIYICICMHTRGVQSCSWAYFFWFKLSVGHEWTRPIARGGSAPIGVDSRVAIGPQSGHFGRKSAVIARESTPNFLIANPDRPWSSPMPRPNSIWVQSKLRC